MCKHFGNFLEVNSSVFDTFYMQMILFCPRCNIIGGTYFLWHTLVCVSMFDRFWRYDDQAFKRINLHPKQVANNTSGGKKIRHARRPSGIGNHRVVFSYFECFFATFSPTCRNRATKPFWLRFCMQDLDLKSLIVCIQLCAEVNCMFYTYAIWGKVYPFLATFSFMQCCWFITV